MVELNEALLIGHIERRLSEKYPHIPPEEVAAIVQSEVARFAQSRIREYVPLLIERHGSSRLAKLESLAPAM